MASLTAKQKAFVREYIVWRNATKAAKKAGYSEKTAGVIGHENLRKPQIAEAIKKEDQKNAEELGITQRRLLDELAKLAFTDLPDLVNENGQLKDFESMSANERAVIQEITVHEKYDREGNLVGAQKKVKLHDKKSALQDLEKITGLLTEKVEHDHGPLVVRWANTEEETNA